MAPPVFGKDFSAAATVLRGERVPRIDQAPIVDVLPADEDMSVEEHGTIVVDGDMGGPADGLSPVVGCDVAAATVIRGERATRGVSKCR